MTVDEWLAAREPAPPPALLARMRETLADMGHDDAARAHDVLLSAGASLLERMLGTGDEGRGAALDLLAADALVTYAFEAAAEDATTLAPRADAALARLAALGEA